MSQAIELAKARAAVHLNNACAVAQAIDRLLTMPKIVPSLFFRISRSFRILGQAGIGKTYRLAQAAALCCSPSVISRL